jgi:hypothetical protein
MLTLYVTNNLDGYTGNAFYDYTQQVNSNDDPFGSWYGDLFFVNRRKRLKRVGKLPVAGCEP